MALYRKKPVVVEAIRFDAYTMALSPWRGAPKGGEVWQWLVERGADFDLDQIEPGPAFLVIRTLEGPMRAHVGDWIIKGIKGELYPCKPDIFEATYEPVD